MAEQPQGTEYTLQGVMRFLQIEWHNHERARNAWDIERAEMKAKIAKQEGDCRNSRKMNESLDRQIRMLERALKHERAKNKAQAAGDAPPKEEDVKKEVNGKTGFSVDLKKNDASQHDTEQQESQEQGAVKDKSRQYLQKCVEELTYLLIPPANPPPTMEQLQAHHANVQAQDQARAQLQNNAYMGQQTQEEMHRQQQYEQQQHQQQQQARRSMQPMTAQLPSAPNRYPPPPTRAVPEELPSHQIGHPSNMAPPPALEDLPTQINAAQPLIAEQDRSVPGLDPYGRPIPNREPEIDLSRPLMTDDTDGWNFDDAQPDLVALPSTDDPALRSNAHTAKSPPRTGHRRRSSGSTGISRRRSDGVTSPARTGDPQPFRVRFAFRGHLDVVRSVIFTGGGTPSEPEICTTGDDGMIKRWIIPSSYSKFSDVSQQQQQGQQQQQQQPRALSEDLDLHSYFTHRGHEGVVTCLAACPASPSFSTGGRVLGDGWIFSGGQDATIRVWERGRVDPKATLDGHTDAVWAICVLPATSSAVFGNSNSSSSTTGGGGSSTGAMDPGTGERILLASGAADNTVKIWAVSAPPQLSSPQNAPSGSRRGVGGSRRHSITSGSAFPSSPQPSTASGTPFHHTLLHSIEFPGSGPGSGPTCISPIGLTGESFVVSYSDASIAIFDTRTGEQIVGMASGETYDGTPATGVNSVVVTGGSTGGAADQGNSLMMNHEGGREEEVPHGATGSSKSGGIEGW